MLKLPFFLGWRMHTQRWLRMYIGILYNMSATAWDVDLDQIPKVKVCDSTLQPTKSSAAA